MIFVEFIGIRKSNIEFLSICLRNLSPRPFPFDAPSIIPGMSARMNDLSSL